jgi:hypothetical protein
MGLFRKPTKQDFPDLPDNLYFARLAKISSKEGKESGKPYTSWGFEIVQPPFQKRWVWANTQPTVGPKSQAGKILTALGVDIATVDENFNEQTLIGTYIKVLVETTENKDGDKFQNVTKLMPILDSEQSLLQGWLAQLNVTGAVRVASQANPTAPRQQPVLAAAPVSLPAAPVVTGFPPVTAQQPVAVVPQPVAAAATPAPAAPVAAQKAVDFPF